MMEHKIERIRLKIRVTETSSFYPAVVFASFAARHWCWAWSWGWIWKDSVTKSSWQQQSKTSSVGERTGVWLEWWPSDICRVAGESNSRRERTLEEFKLTGLFVMLLKSATDRTPWSTLSWRLASSLSEKRSRRGIRAVQFSPISISLFVFK